MKKNEALEGLMLRYDFNEADLLGNAELMGFNIGHEWDKLKKYQIRNQLGRATTDEQIGCGRSGTGVARAINNGGI